MFDIINIAHAGVISSAPSFSQIGMKALMFLLSIAAVVDIIMMVIAGIMYLFSAGDQSRMGKAKKTFFAAVIGIVMIFSAFIIVNFVGQFFK